MIHEFILRDLAKTILEDEMSEQTEEHIKQIPHLEEWLIDAMVEYGKALEELSKRVSK